MTTLAIGVGSFSFLFDENSEIDQLDNALSSIDNISNIYIGSDFDCAECIFLNSNIKFDLHIPFRVQEKYAFGMKVDFEKFTVEILDLYDENVAFIYYEIPDNSDYEQYDPATLVIIARKFLEEKFKDIPDVKFESIGPSPFHANFFLKLSQFDEESETRLSKAGYDLIKINSNDPKNVDAITYRIQNSIAAFYALIELRNNLNTMGWSILEKVDDLKGKKIKGWPINRYKISKEIGWIIECIHQEIIELRINEIYYLNFVQKNSQPNPSENSESIRFYLEQEASQIPKFPISEIENLLQILENKRQKFIDNSSLIISALIGGVIGSIIGAVVATALTMTAANYNNSQFGSKTINHYETKHEITSQKK